MKKFSLALALLAAGVTGAGAQIVEDAGIAATFQNWEGKNAIYDVAIISEEAKATLEAREDVTVNTLQHWFETWGDMGRYASNNGNNEEWLATVGPDGGVVNNNRSQSLIGMYECWWNWWSMAVCQQKTAIDLSHINANTHLHMAFKILSDVVTSPMNISLFTTEDNNDNNHIYACPKFTLTSETFNPAGTYKAEYPIIGTLKKGDWVAIDITLGELDEINKANNGDAIDYERLTDSWTGRLWTIAVPSRCDEKLNDGAVFALDAVYFYTPVEKKPEPVYVGRLKDDATIEATFANWSGKKAIYDVMMIGDIADSKLKANEDVTRKIWQTYIKTTSGNLWRTSTAEGDDQMRLECTEDYKDGKLSDWPNHLFQIQESAEWGDGHIDFKQDEYGVDLKHFNADTRFHFALRLYRNGQPVPQPINFYLFRQDENDLNTPRFSLMEENVARTNGNHADAPNPIITGVRNGDWMAVDVSLGELDDALKQMTNGEQYVDYSRFENAEYKGNVYNIHIPLDNTNPKVNNHLAIDGIYFYTPQDKDPNGLESVSDERNVEVSVTGRQISVAGGEGIEVYNPAGMTVARTEGTTVNVADAPAGVYVVKAAGKTVKVVLK